jgi:hypothetical protein
MTPCSTHLVPFNAALVHVRGLDVPRLRRVLVNVALHKQLRLERIFLKGSQEHGTSVHGRGVVLHTMPTRNDVAATQTREKQGRRPPHSGSAGVHRSTTVCHLKQRTATYGGGQSQRGNDDSQHAHRTSTLNLFISTTPPPSQRQ